MDRTSLSVVLMSGVLAFSGCAPETVAHQQLERDANKIVHLLRSNGIEAGKIKDEESRDLRFNVTVRGGDQATMQALTVLEEHNLPEDRKPDTADMFQEGGMIPTTQQERAKREVGVTGDIINQLRKVPRVVDVGATVSIPEDNPLRDVNEARPRPKASVFILYQPDANNTPPITVEEVQRFVQARLPEMRPTEVSVLMLPSKDVSAIGQNGDGMAAAGGPMIDPTKACKKQKTFGIEVCEGNTKKLLNFIIGAVITAGLLAAMAIVAVLRAMRYRKDLTRLTAQFERVKGGR